MHFLKHNTSLFYQIIICSFSLVAISPTLTAQIIPIYEPLKKVETEKFIVIYQASVSNNVIAFVAYCDEVATRLEKVFRYSPKSKVYIFMMDNIDEHNGFTTIYPQPIMGLYVAGSPPNSIIYEPSEELMRTFIHEYTHLLTTSAQYGLDKWLFDIFGRVQPVGDPLSLLLTLCSAPPGVLAPTWYLEGLATWAETEFTSYGRGRSALVDMQFRMAYLTNKLLAPTKWALELPYWPYGNAPYLYGLRAIAFADKLNPQKTPEDTIGALVNQVNHSFLCFFDNEARPITGKTFDQIAQESIKQEALIQERKVKELSSMPFTQVIRLTPKTMQVAYPRFSEDGKEIFFIGKEEWGRDTLYSFHIADSAKASLKKIKNVRLDYHSSSLGANCTTKKMMYSRLEVFGWDRLWYSVFVFDPVSEETVLIADEARYRYPSPSSDGKTFVAIKNIAGTFKLVLVEIIQDKSPKYKETILYSSEQKAALLEPAFTRDERQVIFIEARNGISSLKTIELKSKEPITIFSKRGVIINPVALPNEDAIIFSADFNGVFNLYKISLNANSEPIPLTHMLSGAFMPDCSPDGKKIAFVAYDENGYFLTVKPIEELKPISEKLPVITQNWRDSNNEKSKISEEVVETNKMTLLERPYSSYKEIKFNYWTPILQFSSEEDVEYGLFFNAGDPAGYQNITLFGGLESRWETPIGLLKYQNAENFLLFNLFANYEAVNYHNLVKSTDDYYYDYAETLAKVGFAFGAPLYDRDYELTLNFGYAFKDRKAISENKDEYRGKELVSTNFFEGAFGMIFAKATYLDATYFPKSSSLEDGSLLELGIEQASPSFGGQLEQTRALGRFVEYLPVPLLENHILKLEVIGGTGRGDEFKQGYFGLGGIDTFSGIEALEPDLPDRINLRGYEENYVVGKSLVKTSIAYRMPILNIYEGFSSTAPAYRHQIFAEFFYDGGKVWQVQNDVEEKWLNAIGLELNFGLTLFRFLPIAPGIGIAYAFDREERLRGDEEESSFSRAVLYLSVKSIVNF